MNVLIVGSGGREHALLWELRCDRPHDAFYAAPGNAGTAELAENVAIAASDIPALVDFCEARSIDLVVVGPEAPLAAGLVDALWDRRIPAFGPRARAAEIESSKAFAKEIMKRNTIPTAAFETFQDVARAESYIRTRGAPIVVKASGLAGGKGSIVCETVEEALRTARSMLEDRQFGEAGATVVVEEFLEGEELSLLFLCDGADAVPMLGSQDHKRLGEGDTGPNTGGMGAYAPVSIADETLVTKTLERIVQPALWALAREDRVYRGCLYVGLMVKDGEPYVVEFNCRFGDPEAQAILPLLRSPLFETVERIARGGSVRDLELEWSPGAAVCIVLASAGYPGAYEKGKPISIPGDLVEREDILIFHAGTRRDAEKRTVTDGGRVLNVVGVGPNVPEAARISREAAELIEFEGKIFRRDIAWRQIERLGIA
ncbi:MAG: phosphoribosylamine--glycine ligase [Gemmatimonadetes bacterium]|nr:phosphoribosylamine--glycine ligase [Gemmatimonadota bacterium]